MYNCLFKFLLTRPSRDVTPSIRKHGAYMTISTHTPLAGRDRRGRTSRRRPQTFLLTRPSRDVTTTVDDSSLIFKISTHTPLAGRDWSQHYPV